MYWNLLRKNYNLTLKLSWKEIIVRYKQAYIKQLLEFLEESQEESFDLILYVCNFIEINGKITLTDEQREEIEPKIVEIFKKLQETLFKSFFNDTKGGWGSKWPFSSFLMIICDKFACDPKYLIENYTWEEITSEDWYTDWIIWNVNEQTKEWQQKNKQKTRFKETFTNSVEEDLKIARKAIKD